ncbi:MAG: KUP/HAK/KT family potassium transporter, partial [Sediminibacterium sp.]|nr:KUP/HAK/KT family potassium transporter [Sediminibacterium sp.]
MIETKRDINKLSAVGMVIATGIVFGDLGTSPLYVFSAIVNDRLIEKELIYGAISLVFMTLTIITSIKYIYLFLKADNQGEGGILSLFALIRRYYKYLYIPAIIGACCILADGMITPAISITSAIEGLNLVPFFKDTVVPGNNITVAIIIIILVVLFLFQSFG